MTTRDWCIYEVTSKLGGSLRLVVEQKDIDQNGEREAVGHAAWRKLFEDRRSATARMLKTLCDSIGSSAAHAKFTAAIEFSKGD